jgi:hypothetical protein
MVVAISMAIGVPLGLLRLQPGLVVPGSSCASPTSFLAVPQLILALAWRS